MKAGPRQDAEGLVRRLLWNAVEREARSWRRAGHAPVLWWRDDDARRPSAGLDRLLGLARRFEAPLALAVIPDVDLSDLAGAIRGQTGVCVIQHGCDHLDRNEGGGFSAEFAPQTAPESVAARIGAHWARLTEAIPATPIYAPPWNVLTPNVVEALGHTPLRAVSIYGVSWTSPQSPPRINTHIDIMKWRPAHFRGGAAIAHRLWRQLRTRRRAGGWAEPIGLLTHHRNLDPAAWTFLEAFLARTTAAGSPFAWRSAADLLAERV